MTLPRRQNDNKWFVIFHLQNVAASIDWYSNSTLMSLDKPKVGFVKCEVEIHLRMFYLNQACKPMFEE